MAVKDYSTNPDENIAISGINIGEGCAPSRTVRAAIKKAPVHAGAFAYLLPSSFWTIRAANFPQRLAKS